MASASARRVSMARLSLLASRSREVLSGQRHSQPLIRIESGRAGAIAASTAASCAWDWRVRTSMPAVLNRASASAMAALACGEATAQPAVSRNARRRGFRAAGADRDLVGDLPGVVQRRGEDAGRALAQAVVASAAIERADRDLETDAAA